MRILLVEDYLPLQQSVRQGLHEAGFAVDATGDGEEGLWYARNNPYDVIVLGIMLPKLDGLSLLQKLRQGNDATHVLLLTAKDTLEDRLSGLNAGADDYLVKPFAFSELLARIHALIRRKYDAKNPMITVGDLRIDSVGRRAWRDEKEIELTAREYALLHYLAVRTGQIVSRTDIWENVYEFHASAASNVVDVYIGYLRRKIEQSGRPVLIHTIHGRGYCLGDKP